MLPSDPVASSGCEVASTLPTSAVRCVGERWHRQRRTCRPPTDRDCRQPLSPTTLMLRRAGSNRVTDLPTGILVASSAG
jgi:hypothetical protein